LTVIVIADNIIAGLSILDKSACNPVVPTDTGPGRLFHQLPTRPKEFNP
jgi:hypothetical protein